MTMWRCCAQMNMLSDWWHWWRWWLQCYYHVSWAATTTERKQNPWQPAPKVIDMSKIYVIASSKSLVRSQHSQPIVDLLVVFLNASKQRVSLWSSPKVTPPSEIHRDVYRDGLQPNSNGLPTNLQVNSSWSSARSIDAKPTFTKLKHDLWWNGLNRWLWRHVVVLTMRRLAWTPEKRKRKLQSNVSRPWDEAQEQGRYERSSWHRYERSKKPLGRGHTSNKVRYYSSYLQHCAWL